MATILQGYVQSLLLYVGDSSAFTEDAVGEELLHLLFGEDFEFSVDDEHHVFSVRDMVKAVSLFDGPLEAEAEDDVFDESEHIYHEFFEVGRLPNLGE